MSAAGLQYVSISTSQPNREIYIGRLAKHRFQREQQMEDFFTDLMKRFKIIRFVTVAINTEC